MHSVSKPGYPVGEPPCRCPPAARRVYPAGLAQSLAVRPLVPEQSNRHAFSIVYQYRSTGTSLTGRLFQDAIRDELTYLLIRHFEYLPQHLIVMLAQ